MIKLLDWDYIIIHHSLTKDQHTVDWQAIRRYHTEILGWSDIGYHYGIEKVNNHLECMIGRPIYMQGAHCKGHNWNSIGVCVVGNWDKERCPHRTLEMLAARIIIPLLLTKRSPRNFIDNIVGHHFFNHDKTCPGKLFSMGELRGAILDILLHET